MSYSEVWLGQAVLKCCVIHLSVEVAEVKIHALDVQLLCDQSPLRRLVKVWRQLVVVCVWYLTFICFVYLPCGELFRLLKCIVRHHLTMRQRHGLILTCLKQLHQTASFMDWWGWVSPERYRHRLWRLILLVLVLLLFIRVIIQVLFADNLIQ